MGNIGYVKKDGRGALIKRQNRILTSMKPFYNQDPTFKSQIGPEPQNCFYFNIHGDSYRGRHSSEKRTNSQRWKKTAVFRALLRLCSAAAVIGTENEVKTSSVIAALA